MADYDSFAEAYSTENESSLFNAYYERLERQKGKHTANAIVASKIARAVYFMLERKTGFSLEMMLKGKR